MSSCMIFGATGLCGKEILARAETNAFFQSVIPVTRKPIDSDSPKVKSVVEKNTDLYKDIITREKPSTVFTSLATTRAHAGSAEAFVAVDYGINIDLAKAAKAAGADTFVLVSSAGASAKSPFLYLKTKGRLEDDLIALKFRRTIILRPGPLLGARDESKGFLNDLSSSVFKKFHNTWLGNSFVFPIYGSEIGQIAVDLASKPLTDSTEPEVNIVGGKDLMKLLPKKDA